MNKIFKVIFNRTTQKMEVVSELARSQGKVTASTDERGGNLFLNVLNSTLFTSGMAILALSAISAEAAIHIVSTTYGGGVETGRYQGESSVHTNPYNYYNPGSLSVEDPNTVNATHRYLYDVRTSTGIGLGFETNVKGSSNNASNGIAIGDYSQATGGLSIAIGASSISSDIGSIALGVASRAAGFNSFAAQRQSAATGDYSAAIGATSWANSTASFAIGASATALGNRSFAIGSGVPQTKTETEPNEARRSIYDGQNNTYSYGDDAFSIGTKAKTNGKNAFAIGTNANAGGFKEQNSDISEVGKFIVADTAKSAENAFALGTNTKANSKDSVAFSTNATATGDGAIAFGVKSVANGTGAIAFGNVSNTTGANAISIGWNATSSADKVISIGAYATATKNGATAIGEEAKSKGNYSTALGYHSNVSEANATAVGAKSNVTKAGGSAIGFESESSGEYATAIGHKSKAQGNYSLSLGDESNAIGKNSSAIGKNAVANGDFAIAIGNADSTNLDGTKTQAGGVRAIAVGTTARTSANDTIAVGTRTESTVGGAISMGYQAKSKALDAIAIGTNTNISKAESRGSIAIGNAAGTQGLNNYGVATTTVESTGYRQLSVPQNVGSLQDTVAIGTNSHAYGHDSIAIGTRAQAVFSQNDDGTSRNSLNSGAVAIGYQTIAQGDQAVALGSRAEAVNRQAMALGNDAFASGVGAIVIGGDDSLLSGSATDAGYQLETGFFDANNKKYRQSAATGNGAVVVGVHSQALSQGSTAIGVAATAGDNGETRTKDNAATATTAKEATAVGAKSRAKSEHTTAVGYSAEALGVNSTTVGAESKANSTNAFAGGYNATADGVNATAIGSSAITKADNAIAIGTLTNVSGERAATIGYNNTIKAADTFVLGSNVTVDSVGSVILGSDSTQANASKEDSAKVGKLTYSGFAGYENVISGDYVSIGNSTNARQIKFVAPGNISATSTDAINGSQLYATNDVMNNIATSVNSIFGGNSQLNPNGTITFNNIGGTGKNTIEEAIKAAKTEVKSGSNIHVTPSKGGNGQDVYTVNAYNTTVSASTDQNTQDLLKVEGKFELTTNTTNYEVKLTQKAKELLEKDTVTGVMDNGKGYVKVTENERPREGETITYTVDLSDSAKAKIDNALANFTVGADKAATAVGIDVNKDQKRFDIIGGDNVITSVDGRTIKVDLSDATKNTIKDNKDNIAKGFGLEAQDGNNVNKALGEKVKVVGGNNNINTTIANGEVKINLNNTLYLDNTGSVKIGDTTVNNNGLTINGGPNITKTGIDAGSKKITNVADGEVNSNSKEAVNGSQLHATNQNVTNVSNNVTKLDEFVKKGFNITADNGTEDNVLLGQKIAYTSTDKNIITTVTNNQIDFALNSSLSIGKAGVDGKDGTIGVNGKDGSSVVLNGKDGSIGLTGPKGTDGKSATSNITVKSGSPNVTTANGENGKNGTNVTRIVYDTPNGEEEVATLNDGLRFTGNNADTINKHKLNSLVTVKGEGISKENSTTFASASGNINVKADGNSTLEVQLAKNLNLTNSGSIVIGNTTINDDGLNITNGPNVTQAGINAGDKKITNVANGIVDANSKDAVNGSQLYTVQEIANSGWNIAANGNNQTNVGPKENVSLNNVDSNIIITKTDADNNVTFALNNELSIGGKDGANGKDGKIGVKGADGKDGVTIYGNGTVIAGKDGDDGVDGKIGAAGKNGASVVLNGKDGSIGLTGPKGENGAAGPSTNITVKNGQPGLDGKDGDTKPRLVYTNATGGNEEIATLNDGLKFVGDDNKVITKKLNETLNVTGGITELGKLSDNNIGVVNTNNGLVIKLAKDVNLTKDGSLTIGNSTLNDLGLRIDNGPSVTNTGISAGNKQITNVSSGLTDVNGKTTDLANATTTNAVNVGDLKETVNKLTDATTGGFGLSDDKKTEVKQDLGKTVQVRGKDGVTVTANVTEKALEIALAGDVSVSGKDGKDGSIGVKGADGKDGVTINGNGTVVVGKDGAPGKIGINGKDGANATMTVEKGAPGLDGARGRNGKDGTQTTRIVYTNETGGKEEVATLNDGLRFTGNNEVENKHKLNSLVTIIGEGVTKEKSNNFESATGNINVKADGQGNLTVQLAKNLNLTDSGSVTVGGTTLNQNGITINNGPKITNSDGNVKVGDKDGNTVKITNVKEGDLSSTSTDAVNGSQLYATNQNVTNVTNKVDGGFNIDADKRAAGLDKADNVKLGDTIKFTDPDSNIITTVSDNQIQFGLNSTLSVGGKDGKPGEIGVKGADGKDGVTIKPEAIVFHGIDGVNGKNGADGKDGSASIKVEKGTKGLDGNDGKDGKSKTRIVYEKPDGKTEEVATLNDGLIFGANSGAAHNAKLNTQVDVKGAAENTDWTKFDAGKNVMTQIAGNTITVALARDLAGLNSATFGENNDSTVINKDGITITKKDPNDVTKSDVKLTEDGLSNGGNKIINVADGDVTETSKDAVNGSQLYQVKQIANSGWNLTANGANSSTVKPTETVDLNNKDGNINITKDSHNVTFALKNDLKVGENGKNGSIGVKGADGKDGVTINGNGTVVAGRDGKDGVDGSIGANGKNGSSVVLNGKDGSIGLTGPRGKNGENGASTNITVKDGAQGVDGDKGENGLPGKNGETRIVYKNGGKEEQVANLNDGLLFTGNNADTLNRHKLNTLVKVQGEGVSKEQSKDFKSAAGNINVVAKESDKLEIQLNRELKDLGNASFVKYKDELDKDGKPLVDETAPKTTVNNNGITITPVAQPGEVKSPVTLTQNGLDNGGNEIINVKSNLAPVTVNDQKQPESNSPSKLAGKVNNAATVGDVLNAGWNLQGNGEAVDTVVHNDTVNFINGRGTKVTVESDPQTSSNTIKVDTAVGYVDPATKVDNTDPTNTVKFYSKGNDPVQVTNVASGVRDTVTATGEGGKLTPADVANAIKTAEGDTLTNAVNIGDLKDTITSVSTDAYGLKDKEGREFKQNLGTTAQITGDANINTKVVDVTNKDGTQSKALEVSLNPEVALGAKNGKDGKDGVDGKVTVNGKDGSAVTIDGKDGSSISVAGPKGEDGKPGASVVLNGKDGSIGLTGPRGTDGKDGISTNLTVKNGAEGVDGTNGKDGDKLTNLPAKDGETRLVYTNSKGNPEQIANLNDGLIFTGNNEALNRHKLNTVVKIVGEGVDKSTSDTFKSAKGNINVVAKEGDKLEIRLNRELKDLSNASFVSYNDDGSINTEVPKTVVSNNGLTITPKDGKNGNIVSLTDKGLNNGNNQIVNVKSGIDGQNGKDGQPVKSVNDLTEDQLKEVGTNAANIKDVRNATDALISKGFNITADHSALDKGEKVDNVNLGETVSYTSTDKNIVTTVRDNAIDFGLANNLTVGKDGKNGQPGEAGTIGVKGQDGKDGVSIKGDNGESGKPGEATITVGRNGKDGADGDNGIDGKVGVNGKDGSAVVLNGKDGSIGLNGKDGKDGLTFKSADGAQGVDGKNGKDGLPGKDGKTRIVYQPTDKDGNPIKDNEGNLIKEEVATLNDGLIFAGNNEKLNRHKLNSVVNIIGEVATGINDKKTSDSFKSAAGNINVVANAKDQLEIRLNRDLKDLATANFVEYKEDGSVNADAPKTVVNNNGVTVTPKDGKDGKDGNVVSLTKDGLNNGGNQIVNVKSGINGLNGQNGKDGQPITSVNDLTPDQLKEVGTNGANINDVVNASNDIIEKGFSIAADNGETDHVKLGETVKYTSKDKNIITTVSDNVIDFALNNDLTVGGPGKDGSIGVKGADGTAGVTLNGKDGSIGLTGPKGADGKGASATISVKDGAKGLDGNDGKDGESKTRIVYEKPNGDKEEVATLNDGLRFVGDDGKVIDKKLNETLQISGGDTDLDDLSDDNIGVVNKNGKLVVKLAKNIDLTDEGSITIGDTFIDTNAVGVGDSALTGDSLTVGGDNAITVDGNKGTIGGLTNKTFDPNNFTSGQAATEDQLKQVYDVANSGWDIAANGQNTTNVGPKGKVSFNNEDGNIIITKETTDNNVTFALNNDLTIGGPGKDGKPGKDGAIGVKGADGKTGVTLNGKDGTIGINGKDGSNGTMTFEQGKPGVDGKDGETKTRIVYETKDKDGNPVKEEVATLNDGLKFVGDDGKVITKKLNETLSITGGEKDATKLSDANNIGVVNNNGTLTVKLAKDIDLTKDGSVTIGNTTVNNDGLTIKDGPSVTKDGISAGDKKITNVQDGEISSTSKDAVNGSQLYQVQQVANAGWNLTANGKDKGNVKPGATVDLNNKDGNIVITKEGNNVTFGLNNDLTIGGKDGKDGQIGVAGKDGKDGVTIKGDGTIVAGRDGQDGVDGSIGATGKDGASVVLNGKDGSIGLTGPKGTDGKPGASANITVKDGAEGVDGTNGKDGLPGENGKTRIVYETIDKDGKPVTEQVATLNDGLIFSGNNEETKNRQKLNTEVKVKGEGVDKAASENFKSASGNINVKANGTDTLEVQLAKAIDLTEDGSVTTGGTTVNNNGLTIKDGPSVTKGGIDAKDTKITNVKDGDVTATSKDAVNGSQLYNAIENAGWELTVDGNVAADSEEGSKRVNNNGKVAVKGGKNIVVSRKGSTVEVATSDNPEFDSVKVGGTTIRSTVAKDGVNELNIAGSNNAPTRITNVAEGVKGTDAVNVNQLKGAENRLNNRINNVDKDLRAGIAGALAAGNLYHVTQPGKSMVSAGVGTYRGQGAMAVGYSRLSDNGKVGIKFSVNSNSRGHAGAAASVGYQW
ncbi:YadA-like family protein [Mannheimia indoligenes]|uniref:YadA-like family protein n=1 Tax=Mannheimia indoligenes TaxID=3103145 RepID=UPI002FE54A46